MSKFKTFADDKVYLSKEWKVVLDKVVNIVDRDKILVTIILHFSTGLLKLEINS